MTELTRDRIVFTTPSLVLKKRLHAAFSVVLVPLLAIVAIGTWPHLTGNERLGLPILTLIFYTVGQIGITMGFHRLFSHQSYSPTPAVAWVLGVLGSITAQGPILNWVSDHRRHHAFGDQPGDPHSPYFQSDSPEKITSKWRGLWHAQSGWMFAKSITNFAKYSPDLLKDSLIMRLSAQYFYWVGVGLLVPTIIGWVAIGGLRGAILGLLWGGFLRLFIAYQMTWATNSINHMFGAHDFPTSDYSTNVVVLGVFGFGEGWHNNHHAFPNSAQFGLKWWQIDIPWYLLKTMERLRLIRDLRSPSRDQIQRKMERVAQ